MIRRLIKFILFLILLGAVFVGGFFLHKWLTPFEQTSFQAPVQTFTWEEKEIPLPDYIVPPGELVKALPARIEGWELQENPYASLFQFDQDVFSMARIAFTRKDAVLSLKISDVPFSSSLFESLKNASQFREESTLHFRKGIQTDVGYGYEAYYKDEKRGEIQLIAYDRFWITIEGYELPGPEPLRTALKRVSFPRLEGFKRKYKLPQR